MIVIVSAMMVAGLATAIGKWPAALIVFVLFCVFVWMIPSAKAPSGKPSWRAGRVSAVGAHPSAESCVAA